MTKSVSVFARVTPDENKRLEKLMQLTLRSKTDMVRWLINKEYDRIFDPKGEKRPEAETNR